MTRNDAIKYTQDLLAEHGLGHMDVVITRTKKALGQCVFLASKPFAIRLSGWWIDRADDATITDTIRHEVAHAIAGIAAGHGPQWQRVAKELGANPEQYATSETVKEITKTHSKYVATCGNGHQVHFDRMGRHWREGNYRCKCGERFTVETNR